METELEFQNQTGPEEYVLPDVPEAGTAATIEEEREPGPQALARLIEYAPGRHIALPPHTTYALIDSPVVTPVPGAAHHACGLLTWQGVRLPMIDLNALLHADVSAATKSRYALVVAWQCAQRTPLQYGAIALDQLPQTVSVSDEASCALPQDSNRWPQLALSCFRHADEAVPILNTGRLFALRPA